MKKKFALILIAITSFLATSTLKSTQNFQTTLAMEDYDPKDENRQFTPQPPANYSDLHKEEYEEGDTPLGLPKHDQIEDDIIENSDNNMAKLEDDVNKKASYNLHENLETKMLSNIDKIKSDLELIEKTADEFIKNNKIPKNNANKNNNIIENSDNNMAKLEDDVNKKASYNLYENLKTTILLNIDKIKSDLELFDNEKISTKTITRQTIENLSNMVKAYKTTLKNPLIKNNENIKSNLNCFIEKTKSTINLLLDDENEINEFYENFCKNKFFTKETRSTIDFFLNDKNEISKLYEDKLKKLSETNKKNLENQLRDYFKESHYHSLKKALEIYKSAIIMLRASFN